MDVFIRGCDEHLLRVLRNNTNCEVLVLEPHGDLIDRDEAIFFMGTDGDYCDFQKGWDSAVQCLVKGAKTIIPSNKEEST